MLLKIHEKHKDKYNKDINGKNALQGQIRTGCLAETFRSAAERSRVCFQELLRSFTIPCLTYCCWRLIEEAQIVRFSKAL